MTAPTISVVTAVFNRAGTITRAIDSLATQTHAAEHVVIDGASCDGTLEVVQQHATPNTTIISEPDDGIYDALNKGIEAAQGEVIGLLHSDDLFASPQVLEQVAQAFADPELDAVFADAAFFRAEDPGRIVRRYRSHRFGPQSLAWGLMPAHPTLYLRRSVFERFGVYRRDFKIAADYEFVARIFGEGQLKYRYIAEIWMKMQMGGASTAGLRSTLQLNVEVMRACRENGIKTSWPKLLSKYPAKLAEYINPA